MNKLEELRAAIIKAVPDKCFHDHPEDGRERSIRLSDVLSAIPNKSIAINGIGIFIWDYAGEVAKEAGGYWDFSKTLDEQSQETIDFLHSLLVTNKSV
jgi:hypothetical protein